MLLIEVLAREHTETAVATLVQIMTNERAKGSERVAAAVAVLDRGWGKPKQDVILGGHVDVSTLTDAAFDDALKQELAGYIVSRSQGSDQAPDQG